MPFQLALGRSHYFDGVLSIGAFIKDKSVVLIDSGLDDSAAKQIQASLKKDSLELKAIINTHSHADHCGGNSKLQASFKDVKIYASAWEKPFIEMPKLEPVCFCGGAAPFQGLQTKFLEAKPSKVTNTLEKDADHTIDVLGETFKIVTLPGHTRGSIGVVTPDKILYCGDAMFYGDTLTKHGVLFYTDIEETLKSLNKLSRMHADGEIEGCVFYHGGYVEKKELAEVPQKHIDRLKETNEFIRRQVLQKPLSIDTLTQMVMQNYRINPKPELFVQQYTLTRTCVSAYLTYLEKANEIELKGSDCMLVAQRKGLENGKGADVDKKKIVEGAMNTSLASGDPKAAASAAGAAAAAGSTGSTSSAGDKKAGAESAEGAKVLMFSSLLDKKSTNDKAFALPRKHIASFLLEQELPEANASAAKGASKGSTKLILNAARCGADGEIDLPQPGGIKTIIEIMINILIQRGIASHNQVVLYSKDASTKPFEGKVSYNKADYGKPSKATKYSVNGVDLYEDKWVLHFKSNDPQLKSELLELMSSIGIADRSKVEVKSANASAAGLGK